jgi:hypothetical protein
VDDAEEQQDEDQADRHAEQPEQDRNHARYLLSGYDAVRIRIPRAAVRGAGMTLGAGPAVA